MAFLNPSNQLIQIDSGNALTYLFNPSVSPIQVYANLGESQVPGQRYFSISSQSASNPYGAPAIYVLVYYKSTAQPAPTSAPAPVYWTDATYTTVSGVQSEALIGLNGIAGYMMVNTTSYSGLTATLLQGALVLIQVAGHLVGGVSPASIVAGDYIIGASGNWTPARVAQGTAPGYKTFGVAETAVASGLCNILLNCDII
jgi:hypothetical protein